MLAKKQQAIYRHFLKRDPKMAELYRSSLEHEKPLQFPNPKTSQEYFKTLVNSIVSQQISTKAAESVFKKLHTAIELTPNKIKTCSPSTLTECGLSKQKVEYIQTLAINWNDLGVSEFANCDDTEIIQRLTSCRGIGVWTADMFLIFAMARDNVFSVHDLGLRQQIATTYNIDREDKTAIKQLAENWHPYRTHASLTLWHQLDNGPVLL